MPDEHQHKIHEFVPQHRQGVHDDRSPESLRLAREELLQRVNGGVVSKPSRNYELLCQFCSTQTHSPQQNFKQAADLISHDDSIVLEVNKAFLMIGVISLKDELAEHNLEDAMINWALPL